MPFESRAAANDLHARAAQTSGREARAVKDRGSIYNAAVEDLDGHMEDDVDGHDRGTSAVLGGRHDRTNDPMRKIPMTCVSGFLLPVTTDREDVSLEAARRIWPLCEEYCTLHHVRTLGDTVPDDKTTDFKRAVTLEDGETDVSSWIARPDKATSEASEAAMEIDARLKDMEAHRRDGVGGARRTLGAFETILDERA